MFIVVVTNLKHTVKLGLTEGSEIYEQRCYYFKSDDEKFLVTTIFLQKIIIKII